VIKVQGSKLGVEFTIDHPFNHHEHKPEHATPFQHPTLKMIPHLEPGPDDLNGQPTLTLSHTPDGPSLHRSRRFHSSQLNAECILARLLWESPTFKPISIFKADCS